MPDRQWGKMGNTKKSPGKCGIQKKTYHQEQIIALTFLCKNRLKLLMFDKYLQQDIILICFMRNSCKLRNIFTSGRFGKSYMSPAAQTRLHWNHQCCFFTLHVYRTVQYIWYSTSISDSVKEYKSSKKLPVQRIYFHLHFFKIKQKEWENWKTGGRQQHKVISCIKFRKNYFCYSF